MEQYHKLLKNILENGTERTDRTGVGTKSIFGYQMRFDLTDGFPLVTTKKIHIKSVIHELLWFLKGDTNIDYLKKNGVTIWDEWATADQTSKFGRKEGDLGPIYGHQWRNYGGTLGGGDGIDQINNVINQIKINPDSRRLIVTGWNPKDADCVSLPPCHTLFQFYVNKGELSCQLYQRSADAFLGVPFNIASYSLLLSMIASVCDLKPKEFIHTIGDAHIYMNHIDQVNQQLARKPFNLPILEIDKSIKSIDDFRYEHFKLIGYMSHSPIKAPIAI